MNHLTFHLDHHFLHFFLFYTFDSPAAFRFHFGALLPLTLQARWNFNQKMFASLQETPLRHKLLSMTLFLIRNTRTRHSCRASHDPRINTTRISLTTLVKSTIQLTENGLSPNHTRNGPVADATMNAIGSIALGSTIRLFHGITRTLGTTNPRPATSLMITPPLAGLRYSHECGAPGAGNLRFLLPPALIFGHIAAEESRLAAIQQLSHTPAPRRGQKRQALDNLEHLNVQYQIEALLHNFSQLDVSKVPMLQGLPPPQQEQLITGVVHTPHYIPR